MEPRDKNSKEYSSEHGSGEGRGTEENGRIRVNHNRIKHRYCNRAEGDVLRHPYRTDKYKE